MRARWPVADYVVAGLELPPVSYDGAALMKALGRRLGIARPVLAIGGPFTASPPALFDDIARIHDQKRAAAQSLQGLFVADAIRFFKASADDSKHPGWPAGTPDGRGGKFRPKDSALETGPLDIASPIPVDFSDGFHDAVVDQWMAYFQEKGIPAVNNLGIKIIGEDTRSSDIRT